MGLERDRVDSDGAGQLARNTAEYSTQNTKPSRVSSSLKRPAGNPEDNFSTSHSWGMALSPRWGLSELLVFSALAIVLLATAVRSEHDGTQKPIGQETSRQYPKLPVLGFVTPWNPAGKELVENHRLKFDLVCPVWYTVHANEDGYEVRGGPPSDDDETWYKRLQQQPSTSADGVESKALQIVPRFILDGWGEQEFRSLVFNETRWQMLSDSIMHVVEAMAFDGVVFESGATHLLAMVLDRLSDALHRDEKILVIVTQPIRKRFDGLAENQAAMVEASNNLIIQALPQLALAADFFSIMTYDMTGPGGRELSRKDIPPDGKFAQAVAQGNMREPGPNTSADWVRENLITFVEATDPANANQPQLQPNLELQQASRKFLMGAPLYGYKYPILFANKATGKIVKPTPVDLSPHAAVMTGAGAPKARYTLPEGSVPLLRAGGEPVTAREIADVMQKYRPEVFKSELEGEQYFDYEAKTGEGYWRVFLPTGESLGHTLETIQDVADDELQYSFGGAGVAFWEVGQSTDELLASL